MEARGIFNWAYKLRSWVLMGMPDSSWLKFLAWMVLQLAPPHLSTAPKQLGAPPPLLDPMGKLFSCWLWVQAAVHPLLNAPVIAQMRSSFSSHGTVPSRQVVFHIFHAFCSCFNKGHLSSRSKGILYFTSVPSSLAGLRGTAQRWRQT